MTRRLAVFILSSFVATSSLATTTWSDATPGSQSVKAVCTTGTETLTLKPAAYSASATYAAGDVRVSVGIPYVSLQADNVGHTPASSPTWWRAIGFSVRRATTLFITVCSEDNQLITDGSGVDLYLWDPIIGEWSKVTGAPYPTPTGKCTSPEGNSPAVGIPILFRGNHVRMAALPTGLGVDGGGITIWQRLIDVNGADL